MPFFLRNLTVSPREPEDSLSALAADSLGISAELLRNFRIVRKGIDARRKPGIKLVYTVSFNLADEGKLHARLSDNPDLEWHPEPEIQMFVPVVSDRRIVIAGSGPAGIFAALRLSEHGLSATILERGEPVEERSRTVQRFWDDAILDPESNVQFGEGGAGTFSDGKLTCRTKGSLTPWILERFTEFGAPPDIRYLAKPHIGTDRLRSVTIAMRSYLLAKGFQFLFRTRLSDIVTNREKIASVITNATDEIPCDILILATGHSARDTYEMLAQHRVPLERKPFAMGLRIEHPQNLIDLIQYGGARHNNIPPADYALTWNNRTTGRSAYSFCMCPGGVVVAGASEYGGVVTNGMSGHLRNSPFANSAIVVNIKPDDFDGADPLGGIRLQRRWEQKAYLSAGGGFLAPAQNLMNFMKLPGAGTAKATYRPGITETDLDVVLPEFVIQTMREGITDFGRRLRGFLTAEATLVGIESRTSAPVRILRDEHGESTGLTGLYPAGEGAGYAGGIMSSAMDGIKIADTIASRLAP